MNTTELIGMLKKTEFGVSGRSREISFMVDGEYILEPDIKIESIGDGICGAEICLKITPKKNNL